MDAGELRERLTFAKRVATDDGAGNTVGDFVDQFTVWGKIQPLRGGEDVMGQRLQGTQPVVITSDWQATDKRTGVVYALGAMANEDRRKEWVSVLGTAGRAA